jgi:hypothetical protein
MTETENVECERKDHLDMWRHYDTLRQAKNAGFMMANSIMVAITGILFKEARAIELIVLSLLSIVVCTSWFLLLSRNAAYIKFHRTQAGKGNVNFWMPKSWTPRSKYLDRVPLSAFVLFWVGVLLLSLARRATSDMIITWSR